MGSLSRTKFALIVRLISLEAPYKYSIKLQTLDYIF